jgi:hypothetical protein
MIGFENQIIINVHCTFCSYEALYGIKDELTNEYEHWEKLNWK